jgi:hypothetical protein
MTLDRRMFFQTGTALFREPRGSRNLGRAKDFAPRPSVPDRKSVVHLIQQ